MQQPTGVWTNGFSYDAAKRLTGVISPAGSFVYDYVNAASRLPRKVSLPNTGYITNTYDNMARLLSTRLKDSTHSTLNGHEYLYNVGNQRTNQAFASGSPYDYTYDNIGQLVHANSTTSSEDRGYLYDAAWNLSIRTNNATEQSFTVDSKNQLATYQNDTFTYDGNGNPAERLLEGGGLVRFNYDDENQLTDAEELEPDNLNGFGEAFIYTTHFVYDGLGRLRKKVEGSPGSGTTLYIYDGMRVIQERNVSSTPAVSYTRGNDLSGSLEGAGGIGGMLALSYGYSSGNFTNHDFYHADGNGNITSLVNTNQSIVASYRYDPFGNTISQSGSLAGSNLYRFSSKQLHLNSGMYYYGYRWYLPQLQRWVNRDPIGEEGGINLYRFVLNNSVNLADPFGFEEYLRCVEDTSAGPPGARGHQKTKSVRTGRIKRLPNGDIYDEMRVVQRKCRFRCYHEDTENCAKIPCTKQSCAKDHGVAVEVTINAKGAGAAARCSDIEDRVQSGSITGGSISENYNILGVE